MTEQTTRTLTDMRGGSRLPSVSMGYGSSDSFELMQRAAKMFANSTLVPKDYQGADNIGNCVIALEMANRIGAGVLQVMQNLIVVHGRPTWSSQFLIATANTCGRFSALRYEFFGDQGTDGWGCRAWAIEKGTNEKLIGTDVTIAIAKKEGWYGKNGSKWQSIPQQMLMYRAGSWWTRVYAPELSMGLTTAEEAYDIVDVSPEGEVTGVTTQGLRRPNETPSAATEVKPDKEADVRTNNPEVNIDKETGEVTGITMNNSGPGVSLPTFDINAYAPLKTQASIKAAINDLAAVLDKTPNEERASAFLMAGGRDLLSAASRAGIGALKEKFIELGINFPPAE